MKTKNLIKRLQECDSTGELQVVLGGEAILGVETLPGYYDGPAHYVEDSEYYPKKYFIDSENDKVRIDTLDIECFIWDNDGNYNNIELKLDNFCQSKEHKKKYIDRFEKIKNEYLSFDRDSKQRHLMAVLNKLKKGFDIIQLSDDKIGLYNVMSYTNQEFKANKETIAILKRQKSDDKSKYTIDHLCQGDCKAVLESGFFEHEPTPFPEITRWRFVLSK